MVAINISLLLAAACLLAAVQADDPFYPNEKGSVKLKWGNKGPNDVRLFKDEPIYSARPLWEPYSNICYPPKIRYTKDRITYYKVEAVKKQGLAYLHWMRKPDRRQVCFHLKALKGQGYHFKIEVWGTKN